MYNNLQKRIQLLYGIVNNKYELWRNKYDQETMGGTPVFTGTRVPVQALFDYIGTGETLDEFLEKFSLCKKGICNRGVGNGTKICNE